MKARLTIADIGFGGGFPIIPLAWANEKLHLIGIERKQRKADFVRTAALALGLKNIQIHVCQAREAANSETLTGSCDAVIARAVGESGMLLKHSRGLLRPEGPAEILLYKTPESLRNELPVAEREAKKHGFTVNVSEEIQLPCEAGQRQFLIFSRRNLRQ